MTATATLAALDAGPPRATWADRLSHRLATHLPLAPTRLSLERPLLTVTFDDAPVSAAGRGARMLEERGARGTYYVATALLGLRGPHWAVMAPEEVSALHARGHEIACHTHAHRALSRLDGDGLARDLARNRAILSELAPGAPLDGFAYPYGVASLPRKRELARAFRSVRGIRRGVNAGLIDLAHLSAEPLVDGLTDETRLKGLLDIAVARRGWLVVYTHDVADDPSPFGCSPRLLDRLLDAASARGVALATLAGALDAAGVPGRAAGDGSSLATSGLRPRRTPSFVP